MARSKKVLQAGFITVGIIGAIMGTVYVGAAVANRQSRSSSQTAQACKALPQASHEVVIQHNALTPRHTTAPLCDTLTITNLDSTVRLLAFGVHEKHQPYDGVGQKVLHKGQSLTITLVQPGNFKFHDHIHDEVQGTFSVTEAPHGRP